MVDVLLVGNVDPQTRRVRDFLIDRVRLYWEDIPANLGRTVKAVHPDLIVVAGWRHLISPEVLAIPRLGTVGFHSAKLPEYPGRAPVPWTLLRGDEYAYNTMFYLDEGIDSGDIIDQECLRLRASHNPGHIYEWMARRCVTMLYRHLPALLDGTAPRTPQDMSKRGPLTTKDGWDRWFERERMATGHA